MNTKTVYLRKLREEYATDGEYLFSVEGYLTSNTKPNDYIDSETGESITYEVIESKELYEYMKSEEELGSWAGDMSEFKEELEEMNKAA